MSTWWDTLGEALRDSRTPTGRHKLFNRARIAAEGQRHRLPDFMSGPINTRDLPRVDRPSSAASGARRVFQEPVSDGIGQAPQSQGLSEQDLLMQRLMQMLAEPVGVDESALRGQLDPVFDARRQAIEDLIARTEQSTARGREEIEGMFGALAEDYEQRAPEARARGESAREEADRLFGELRETIEGNYTHVADEQANLLQRLGIEAAAPDVLTPQSEHAAAAMSRADELGSIHQQRHTDLGVIDEAYYEQGAPLARLAGSNRSADLLQQLQDFMGQQSSEINMIEAERSAAFQQMLAQQQQQAQRQERENLEMLLQMMGGSGVAGGEPHPLMEEMGAADTYFSMLTPDIQQTVSNAYRMIEQSEMAITGQVPGRVSGSSVSTNDENWIAAAQEMFDAGMLSPAEFNALQTYIRYARGMPLAGSFR